MNLSEKWINNFMKKAAFVAEHSSCGYKIGCVGVIEDVDQFISSEAKKDLNFRRKDGFIYLKTWNETLPGEVYCQECNSNGKRICIREKENLKGRDFQKVCSIHAEVNLIAKCAKYNIPTNGMALFVTNSPCYICAKSIVQVGISAVYYIAEHTDKMGINLLRFNKVKITQIDPFQES